MLSIDRKTPSPFTVVAHCGRTNCIHKCVCLLVSFPHHLIDFTIFLMHLTRCAVCHRIQFFCSLSLCLCLFFIECNIFTWHVTFIESKQEKETRKNLTLIFFGRNIAHTRTNVSPVFLCRSFFFLYFSLKLRYARAKYIMYFS